MKTLLIAAVVILAVAVLAVAVWVFVVQNVEKPPHEVEVSEGMVEIRHYPELIVATVTRDGPRREALGRGFGPLAGYIFAREREGPKIAMTAPVTQERAREEGRWEVSFIMPQGTDVGALPDPANADVRLTTRPARRMAAIRFPGHASDGDIREAEARLLRWLEIRGERAAGPHVYAYYNDPFTPGFLRRNEVLIPLD